jgi:hypothetical protein
LTLPLGFEVRIKIPAAFSEMAVPITMSTPLTCTFLTLEGLRVHGGEGVAL